MGGLWTIWRGHVLARLYFRVAGDYAPHSQRPGARGCSTRVSKTGFFHPSSYFYCYLNLYTQTFLHLVITLEQNHFFFIFPQIRFSSLLKLPVQTFTQQLVRHFTRYKWNNECWTLWICCALDSKSQTCRLLRPFWWQYKV